VLPVRLAAFNTKITKDTKLTVRPRQDFIEIDALSPSERGLGKGRRHFGPRAGIQIKRAAFQSEKTHNRRRE
jgi:hypothetical protein